MVESPPSHRPPFWRRRMSLVVAGLAVALLTAACGGGSSEDSAAGTKQEGKTTAFPVTITQKVAPVTIEKEPVRVVALDFPSADAAIALGVVPVGMTKLSYVEGGMQQWTKDALKGATPELFPTDDGFPFETIARLDPDVILATNTWPLISESWDKLNAIAPVVGHVENPNKDTWQQSVTQIGKALGRSEQAQQLIAQVEGAIAGARTANPTLSGKTVSFFNYVDGVHVINTDGDVSIKFLKELGFVGVTPAVAAMPSAGIEGRAPVSAENYKLLDADLILGTTSGGRASLDALSKHATFSKVPAVARGAYVRLEIGPATAMAFPSALSLPYAVNTLVPQMAKAMGGS
jgi:iron complex transport system substrate-binding protein